MKMDHYYMPTLREVPVDAEIPSHRLLLRAGMIRKSASGIYSYLPLGLRAVQKIEKIVREEMDRAGAQEIRMSVLQPKEIWEQSGRWRTFGPEMFKLQDRGGREFCLGPTAEEYFTDLVNNEIQSYKQLPLNIYQIQWKYRDEKRPRFGINRSREFLMKDAYSFDKDEEGMKNSYQIMKDAYTRVFERLKLEFRVVRGDSGSMGGNIAEEFIALSEVGEGVIVYCPESDYAATEEKATFLRMPLDKEEPRPLEEVSTPGAKTIEQVCEFLNTDRSKTIKALGYETAEENIVVLISGDRELNETKLISYLQVPEHELAMMGDEKIREITGAEVGFMGPIGLKGNVRVIADEGVMAMSNAVCGANKTDTHYINVNPNRDFANRVEIAKDLLQVREGDLCPHTGKALKFARGIEVGNIFQLGTKYSKALGVTFLSENGKTQPFVMGSYGIGITRAVSAVVEQNHDDKGIIWPLAVAPYHAIVTVANYKDDVQMQKAEEIYCKLQSQGVEVLLDNRAVRAGVKFNDRDLIGIPYRITVGKKSGEDIVEFSLRSEGENEELNSEEAISRIQYAVSQLN